MILKKSGLLVMLIIERKRVAMKVWRISTRKHTIRKKAEIEKLDLLEKNSLSLFDPIVSSAIQFLNTLQLFLQIPLKGQDVIHLIRLYRKLRRR